MKKLIRVVLLLLFLQVNEFELVYSQTIEIINSDPPEADFVQLKYGQVRPSDLISLNVPTYLWSYGCHSTAAAMLIGYYDQGCFPKLYQGNMNGGVAPFSNSFWVKLTGSIMNYKNSISYYPFEQIR